MKNFYSYMIAHSSVFVCTRKRNWSISKHALGQMGTFGAKPVSQPEEQWASTEPTPPLFIDFWDEQPSVSRGSLEAGGIDPHLLVLPEEGLGAAVANGLVLDRIDVRALCSDDLRRWCTDETTSHVAPRPGQARLRSCGRWETLAIPWT